MAGVSLANTKQAKMLVRTRFKSARRRLSVAFSRIAVGFSGMAVAMRCLPDIARLTRVRLLQRNFDSALSG